jgi:hypothetical protein
MGFRFRRRVGLGPFRVNLSKSGISLSAGVPGLTVNAPLASSRKRGPRLTVGLPGTGLSYSVRAKVLKSAKEAPPSFGVPLLSARDDVAQLPPPLPEKRQTSIWRKAAFSFVFLLFVILVIPQLNSGDVQKR